MEKMVMHNGIMMSEAGMIRKHNQRVYNGRAEDDLVDFKKDISRYSGNINKLRKVRDKIQYSIKHTKIALDMNSGKDEYRKTGRGAAVGFIGAGVVGAGIGAGAANYATNKHIMGSDNKRQLETHLVGLEKLLKEVNEELRKA